MIRWLLLCILILAVSPSEIISSSPETETDQQLQVETQTDQVGVEVSYETSGEQLRIETQTDQLPSVEGLKEGDNGEGLTEGDSELLNKETLEEDVQDTKEDPVQDTLEEDANDDTEEKSEVPSTSPVLDFWDVLESFQTCTLQGNSSTPGDQDTVSGLLYNS